MKPHSERLPFDAKATELQGQRVGDPVGRMWRYMQGNAAYLGATARRDGTILILALLLCSCAPALLRESVDTTAWAATQDSCFAGTTPCSHVEKFEPLCAAQRAIVVTNLVYRQDMAMSRVDAAYVELKVLCPKYCVEDWSYGIYMRDANDWWNKTQKEKR